MPRDALPTLPYETSAEALRRRADQIEEAAVELLRVALDLRRIADAIEEDGKLLTE